LHVSDKWALPGPAGRTLRNSDKMELRAPGNPHPPASDEWALPVPAGRTLRNSDKSEACASGSRLLRVLDEGKFSGMEDAALHG
jgi:hypothetical protein